MRWEYDTLAAKALLIAAEHFPAERDELMEELVWTGFLSVDYFVSAYVYSIFREVYFRESSDFRMLFNDLSDEYKKLDPSRRWSVETWLQRAFSEGMTVQYADLMRRYQELLIKKRKEEKRCKQS